MSDMAYKIYPEMVIVLNRIKNKSPTAGYMNIQGRRNDVKARGADFRERALLN